MFTVIGIALFIIGTGVGAYVTFAAYTAQIRDLEARLAGTTSRTGGKVLDTSSAPYARFDKHDIPQPRPAGLDVIPSPRRAVARFEPPTDLPTLADIPRIVPAARAAKPRPVAVIDTPTQVMRAVTPAGAR